MLFKEHVEHLAVNHWLIKKNSFSHVDIAFPQCP